MLTYECVSARSLSRFNANQKAQKENTRLGFVPAAAIVKGSAENPVDLTTLQEENRQLKAALEEVLSAMGRDEIAALSCLSCTALDFVSLGSRGGIVPCNIRPSLTK